MKRLLEWLTLPIWLPVMAAWALICYLAGWIDWMAGGER
jgi:hypothetical protein